MHDNRDRLVVTTSGQGLLGTEVTFVRPANTTAYAAGDVIFPTGATELHDLGVAVPFAGDGGVVISAKLWIQGTITSAFRLWIFTGPTLETQPVDNDNYLLPSEDFSTLAGYIDFDSPIAASSATLWVDATVRLGFKTGTSQNLYGLLQTVDGFTPTSSQSFKLQIATI